MSKNYRRGRSFEYRVKSYLESKGFSVVRSAGSRSPADLVAGRNGLVLLVQCTTTDTCKDDSDRLGLVKMAEGFGAVPIMVWKECERGPLVWETLLPDIEVQIDGDKDRLLEPGKGS